MKTSGIYKIQSNIKPNKVYIGSGVNIGNRWRRHLSDLRLNRHCNKKLQNHFNKYGESDLVFSIVLGCERDDLIKIEQYFIDSYKPWFNICPIAKSIKGLKFSAETKEKMSKARKGKQLSKEHIANLTIARNKRGPYSEESKLKISLSGKGRKSWNKGMTGIYSEETLQKMRNKIFTSEHLKKLSESHKGIRPSEETKIKMSIAGKNRIMTPEHRDNLKKAWKVRRFKIA